MENMKNSSEYKSAYARAQKLMKIDPKGLEELINDSSVSNDQRQAYSDILSEFMIEKDLSENQTRRNLFTKYGQRFTQYEAKLKEKRKFKDR